MNWKVRGVVMLVALLGFSGTGAKAIGAAEVVPPPAVEDAEEVEKTISMDFQEAGLKDVLKVFSQQTGINVIAGADVEDRKVTIYFEDVSPMDALDQILRVSGLVYERPLGSQIYVVKPALGADKVAPVTETRVYRLRYARVSTSRLAKAAEALGSRTPFEALQLTQLSTASGGGAGGGGGSGGGGASFGGGSGGTGGGAEKEIGIDKVIQELLTEQGKVAVDERTNSLIISDVPANFARIETALNALDIRTAQILIEAEVLETNLAKLKDLGVEWGTSGEFFKVTPAKRATRFPLAPFFGDDVLTKGDTPIGMTMGTFDSSKAVASLQALERDTDTKILARPKVLTLDNESAVIRLTSQQAIGFQTTTGVVSGTTGGAPERTTTGVILVVTPQVNDDGYITMLVEPSVTKVVASTITPPTSVGGTVFDPKSRSARSMVRIRNGDTLVIGGLIDRSEEHGLKAVPVLSGIPIFGEVFKNREVNDTATELIVFVTPRILSEPAAALAQMGPVPALSREQAPARSRQESMEQALNSLDQP